MKRKLCFVFAMVLCLSFFIPSFAKSVKTSGLFTYDIKGNGTAVITDFDWESNGKADIYIPNMIDGYTVTEIGELAFSDKDAGIKNEDDSTSLHTCGEPVVVVLPNTITVIGKKAFFCTRITSINIPASVQVIGEGAFGGCIPTNGYSVDSSNAVFATIKGCLYNKQQKELIAYCKNGEMKTNDDCSIPEGIVSIGAYAVYNQDTTGPDSKTVAFSLPSTLKSIGDYSFCRTTMPYNPFPDTLETIGEFAFWHSSVEQVIWPSSLVFIGKAAFENATVNNYIQNSKESKLILPRSLREIGERAFCDVNGTESDPSFDEVDLGLTQIGEIPNHAFARIKVNNMFCLPKSCTIISDYSFAKTEFASVNVPESVMLIGSMAFTGGKGTVLFDNQSETLENPKYNGLVLMNYAFKGFEFTNPDDTLTLPNQCSLIDDGAFINTNGLSTLVIPKGVSEIGNTICDRSQIKLSVEKDSYAAIWAQENGYSYSTGEDDTSWLNG